MTLKQHLFLATGGAFILLLLALAYAVFAQTNSNGRFQHLIEMDISLLLAQDDLYAGGLQSSSSLRSIVLDPANKTGYDNLRKGLDDFEGALSRAKGLVHDDEATQKQLDTITELHAQRRQLIEQIMGLATTNPSEATTLLNSKEIPLWRNIRGNLLEMLDRSRKEVASTREISNKASHLAVSILLTLMLVGVLVASSSLIIIVRRLNRQLGGDPGLAANIAQRVADGDLSSTIPPAFAGSVIHTMRDMQDRLVSIVKQIRDGATQLAQQANVLAKNEASVAKQAREQTDEVSALAAAIEQMTVAIQQVAELSNRTRDLASSAGEQSVESKKTIGRVIQEMDQVTASVQDSAAVIHELSHDSERIAGIVSVIREIADQTNLLALNAAIEAARAGEQGRGFAVVADEVRKLAERTAQSTVEISQTIKHVGDRVSMATQKMSGGVDSVAKGADIAREAGESIDALTQSSQDVIATVDDIANAITEQSSVSTMIAQRIEHISQLAENNCHIVEDEAKATNAVSAMASELEQTVSGFRLS